MQKLIESVTSGVPATLTELRRLGRTLKRGAGDVLAYFDRPGISNGPTGAQGHHRTPPPPGARLPQPRRLPLRMLLAAGGLRT